MILEELLLQIGSTRARGDEDGAFVGNALEHILIHMRRRGADEGERGELRAVLEDVAEEVAHGGGDGDLAELGVLERIGVNQLYGTQVDCGNLAVLEGPVANGLDSEGLAHESDRLRDGDLTRVGRVNGRDVRIVAAHPGKKVVGILDHELHGQAVDLVGEDLVFVEADETILVVVGYGLQIGLLGATGHIEEAGLGHFLAHAVE